VVGGPSGENPIACEGEKKRGIGKKRGGHSPKKKTFIEKNPTLWRRGKRKNNHLVRGREEKSPPSRGKTLRFPVETGGEEKEGVQIGEKRGEKEPWQSKLNILKRLPTTCVVEKEGERQGKGGGKIKYSEGRTKKERRVLEKQGRPEREGGHQRKRKRRKKKKTFVIGKNTSKKKKQKRGKEKITKEGGGGVFFLGEGYANFRGKGGTLNEGGKGGTINFGKNPLFRIRKRGGREKTMPNCKHKPLKKKSFLCRSPMGKRLKGKGDKKIL